MCYDYCMLWWWKRKRNFHEGHTIISQATLGPGAQITGPFEHLHRMLRNSKYWLYLIYIIYTWAGRYSNEFFRHASGHASKALDFKCLRFCPRCHSLLRREPWSYESFYWSGLGSFQAAFCCRCMFVAQTKPFKEIFQFAVHLGRRGLNPTAENR